MFQNYQHVVHVYIRYPSHTSPWDKRPIRPSRGDDARVQRISRATWQPRYPRVQQPRGNMSESRGRRVKTNVWTDVICGPTLTHPGFWRCTSLRMTFSAALRVYLSPPSRRRAALEEPRMRVGKRRGTDRLSTDPTDALTDNALTVPLTYSLSAHPHADLPG